MSRSFKLYLDDIQKALLHIQILMQGLDEATFKAGAAQVDGILFNLMTIGEAAKHIPPHIQELTPGYQWSQIGRFRDFVVHHYFGLDMTRVWDIVQTDLPELADQIEALMALIKDIDE